MRSVRGRYAQAASTTLLGLATACTSAATPTSTPLSTPTAVPTASPAESAVAEASPTAAGPDFVLVVIGDSIPYNSSQDCPGCTGFVDSYAAALETQLGRHVVVVNESRHDGARTIDIVEQLQTDQNLLDELATADLILISVGYNDQPPYADAHDGCPDPVDDSTPLDVVVQRAAATSHDCIDSVLAVIRSQVAEVFGATRGQAPDAPIGALTAYDSWIGWFFLNGFPDLRDQLYDAESYWLHSWRDAMCAEAEAVGAICVDVYAAFNGPEGTERPAGLLAEDGSHPSQKGNDTIRDALVEANLVSP